MKERAAKNSCRGIFLAAAFFLSGFLAGCASASGIQDQQSSADPNARITLSRLENHLAGSDPWEKFNRSMFAVNSFAMDYIADPLGRIYCSILPRPVIEHFNNLCVNLEFPARAISCLLRAEWLGAGHETVRFLVNSTIGIAGLFDPAEHWLDIHSTDSDFGQAFAAWGIAPGETLTLPFLSALNVRDTVGAFFDMAFDLKTYIPYSGWATALNRMVIAHRAFQKVVVDSNDRYKNYRELALLARELNLRMVRYRMLNRKDELIEQGLYPPALEPDMKVEKPLRMQGRWLELQEYGPGNPVLDSLRSTLFRPQNDDDWWYLRLSIFNNDFSKKRQDRSLQLAENRPAFEYAFWRQPEKTDADGNPVPVPEKLVILLPGIGGTASSAMAAGLAELFNQNDCAVIVIDSTFSWQFVSTLSGCRLPGYLPADAAALRKVISLALSDLKADQQIRDPELYLCGYSMGGMQTLKIAELEQKDPLLGISRFLAINPPVSLEYALDRADQLAGAMRGVPLQEVLDRGIGLVGQFAGASTGALPPYSPDLPQEKKHIYRIQAEPEYADLLAGLYLRSSMRSMLFSAHKARGLIGFDTPVELSRNALYLQLDEIDFREYANKYLAKEYPGVPLETLLKKSDLRSISDVLENHSGIRVLHAGNDFLLSESDREFLDRALNSRITWTSRGGHLGQIYYQAVQQEILKMLLQKDSGNTPAAPAVSRQQPHRRNTFPAAPDTENHKIICVGCKKNIQNQCFITLSGKRFSSIVNP